MEIKRLGGWKSTAAAEGYIEESIGYKRKTGQQIACGKFPQASFLLKKHQKLQM